MNLRACSSSCSVGPAPSRSCQTPCIIRSSVVPELRHAPSAPASASWAIQHRRDTRACSSAQENAVGQTVALKWWQKDSAPNMQDVKSVQELVDALADAGDKLVIVEFYAPWCNACKALYPKICKIMRDNVNDVVFLKVSYEDNKDMCKNLGVKVLPYFQFFRGAEGKVHELSCTVSKIQVFRDAVDQFSGAFCSLEEPTAPLVEFPELHPSGEHHHPDADKITKLAWN